MSKTVFISRELSESSPFATRLQAAGWMVQGFSLVTLTPLPVGELPEADWIFFASGNAVRFFFGSDNPTHRGLGTSPETSVGGVKLAALGPATATELLRYTNYIDFTGTGDPATTADLFRPLAQGQRVLFPAARHSQKSIARLLGDAIYAIHLAIYDNGPMPNPPRLDADVLVFTSPMNAQAYFAQHQLQAHQRVVAIGRTTESALAHLGITGVRVAGEPKELAMADAVLMLGH